MRIRWVGRQAKLMSIGVRAGAIALAIVLSGLLLMWGIDLGRRIISGATHASSSAAAAAVPTPAAQIAALQAELTRAEVERARLAAIADKVAKDGELSDRLTIQIKSLEVENSKLLDDLAEFAGQLPAPKAGAMLAMHRAEAEITAPNQLRVRLLLSAAAKAALAGQLELALVGEQGGAAQTLAFPGVVGDPAYVVGPGKFQKVDVTLALPEGFTVKSLSARVLEKGHVRLQQAVPLRSAYHVRS
jgi:hypothetical protein